MRDLDDIGFGPQEEGESAGAGPPVGRAYDPIFGDWSDGDFAGSREEFSTPPAWLSRRDDDFLTWGLPEPASVGPQPTYASGHAAWRSAAVYTPPQTYSAPLTEAQLALREGVVTIPRPERRWLVTFRELAETVLLALLIFLSVRASFQNFRVEGASMSPSLENGEYLIVNKLSYAQVDLGMFDFLPFFDAGDDPVKHLWGAPERGDVIVFEAPTSPNRDFIKRIIGVPGDTVEIMSSGEVTVNGTVLSEPYAVGTTSCPTGNCKFEVPPEGSPEAEEKCGSNACYFVMGDNRQNSSDSRQNWLVPEENIIGKTLITYWQNGELDLKLAPNRTVAAGDGTEP
jgi:signal peptidase I